MILAKNLGIATVGIFIGLAGVGLPSAAQALQFDFSYSGTKVEDFTLLSKEYKYL